MAISNPGTYGIITGGLGLPACQGMITNFFNLGPIEVEVRIPSGGGGSYPMAPGEFFDRYTVNNTSSDYHPFPIERDLVTFTIRVGENIITSDYAISAKLGDVFVRSLTTLSKAVESLTKQTNKLVESKVFKSAIKPVVSSPTVGVVVKSISTHSSDFVRYVSRVAIVTELKTINTERED